MVIIGSSVRFHDVRVADNVGKVGGGMRAQHSSVFFSGSTVFDMNTAFGSAGAILAIFHTNLSFVGLTMFTNNISPTYGGAIYGVLHCEKHRI